MGAPSAAGSRLTITEDDIGGFRVIIPGPPRRALIGLAFLVLIPWGLLIVAILGPIAAGQRVAGIVRVMAELIGATSFVVTTWYLAAWEISEEVVTLDGEVLMIRRVLGPFFRSRSFELAGLRDLRYSPPTPPRHREVGARMQTVGLGMNLGHGLGSVAFDYDWETIRFGRTLSETEARRLIATIRKRFKIPESPVEPFPIGA